MGREISVVSRRNRTVIVPESFRNLYGILAEAQSNLHRPYPGCTSRNVKILCRFHAEWVAETQRNRSGIVPELFQNHSGILEEA